jgi:hypothetical protein
MEKMLNLTEEEIKIRSSHGFQRKLNHQPDQLTQLKILKN